MDTITLATGIIADRSVTFTATVIVAGIGIVLCTLLVLIGVFYAFGAIVSKSQAKTKCHGGGFVKCKTGGSCSCKCTCSRC